MPVCGRYVLIKCDSSFYSKLDRHRFARIIIIKILAQWMDLDASSIKLEESPHGPLYLGTYLGDKIYISISYTNTELWIALSRGKEVGLDVTEIKYFAELNDVAKIYFNESDYTLISNSKNPELDFARCWSELEAKIKLTKKNIKEFSYLELNDKEWSDFRLDSFYQKHVFVTVAYSL